MVSVLYNEETTNYIHLQYTLSTYWHNIQTIMYKMIQCVFACGTHINKMVQTVPCDYFSRSSLTGHFAKLLVHNFHVVPVVHQSITKKVVVDILL